MHVEDGTAVDAVMAGGRMIVEDGALKSVDVPRLIRDVEAARARMGRPRAPDGEADGDVGRLLAAVDAHCSELTRRPFPVHRYAGPEDR